MDLQQERDVIILGGGISGLATAYRLHRAGLDVLLLEKSRRIGGAIQSESVDGFLIDYGPNSSLETSPKIREFIDELGLKESRVYANSEANRRYIVRNGSLYPLPMNPPQFLKSRLFSTKAKFRLLKEPFISPAPQDKEESIAEFVERRLGREFLDYAINPFVAGVFSGDPARLSVRSAVHKVYELESRYGSLIKGAIKGAIERKRRPETEKNRAQLFSFRHGMATLPEAIKSRLGQAVHTRAKIEKIDFPSASADIYTILYTLDGESITVKAKSVVFTTPAFVTAALVKTFKPAVASVLKEINYPQVAVMYLGFKQAVKCRPLDGFGFLVPQVENRKILGTIWNSTIFPNRVPNGGIALTTFVGGMRQPELAELDEEDLSTLVLEELRAILGLEGEPFLTRIKKWPRAIPQYEIGHQARINTVKSFESENPGLFISGNFRGGISVGDCILESEKVAQKVSAFCKRFKAQALSI